MKPKVASEGITSEGDVDAVQVARRAVGRGTKIARNHETRRREWEASPSRGNWRIVSGVGNRRKGISQEIRSDKSVACTAMRYYAMR